jgi:hypothetical protein
VIEFKRRVYEQALTELARLIFHSREGMPKWPECAWPVAECHERVGD